LIFSRKSSNVKQGRIVCERRLPSAAPPTLAISSIICNKSGHSSSIGGRPITGR